jgi:hypothetical protein
MLCRLILSLFVMGGLLTEVEPPAFMPTLAQASIQEAARERVATERQAARIRLDEVIATVRARIASGGADSGTLPVPPTIKTLAAAPFQDQARADLWRIAPLQLSVHAEDRV